MDKKQLDNLRMFNYSVNHDKRAKNISEKYPELCRNLRVSISRESYQIYGLKSMSRMFTLIFASENIPNYKNFNCKKIYDFLISDLMFCLNI